MSHSAGRDSWRPPFTTAPECEKDIEGRFTRRPTSDSHRRPEAAGGRDGVLCRALAGRRSVRFTPGAKPQTEHVAGTRQSMDSTRLMTVPERANDTGVRCALRASSDARRISCSSRAATTSCGPALRWLVAHERSGPWRERPPSPKARYGIAASVFSHPRASCLGSLPHQRSLAGRPVERRFRGAGPHTRRSLGRRSGGWLRPGSIRRKNPPVQRGQAIRSPLHYVDPDVSVSHPSRRLGSDGPIHSQPGDPTSR